MKENTMQNDTSAIREIVGALYRALREQDVPAMRTLCPADITRPHANATVYEHEDTLARLLGYPEAPLLAPSEPDITVSGDAAELQPFRITTLHESRSITLSFRKEDGVWGIASCEIGPEEHVEQGLPGLGAPFVSLTESWAATALGWAQTVLRENPPQGGDPSLRAHAHLMMDQVLHLNSSTGLAALREFVHSTMDRAVEEMQTTEVTEGACIWKLYNHGWVIKTANHCWVHDLYQGPGNAAMTPEHVDAILGMAEAVFCSHWHGDHISIPVIRRALERGIPVHTPQLPDGNTALRENLNNILDFSGVPRSIAIPGPFEEGDIGGLHFRAYPGHQDELPNTVFMVEADGMTTLQTGDQYNEEDYRWLREIGDEGKVDVFLPWMVELDRLVDAVRPRVVIPGHQNELGHLFEHREPYDQAYEKLRKLDGESYVLSWGEMVRIGKK